MRRLLLLSVLLVTCSLGWAQRPPPVPEITSDTFDADFTSGDAVYRGNARGRWEGVVLTADELRYNLRSRTLSARGHVVLTEGAHRFVASELTYHLATRTYQVRNLRFGSAPLYLSGALVEGFPDRLEFTDAQVTYGEPGRWSPTLVADAVTVYPERERMRASGAALGLGLLQPLPLPGVELPTNLAFLSYLSFNAGYSRLLGAFLEVGVHLPVGEGTFLGGDVGLFSQRGILAGPSGSYARQVGTDHELTGTFSTGFIHDTGEKFRDLLRQPVPEDRGFATWTHRQRLGPRLSLGAVLNYWSDSEVVRDFRPREFFPVQTPDSFAELLHQGDNTVLSFFARPHVNDFHTIRERLPELSFSLLPSPLAGGWYHELQSSAVRLREDPPVGGPRLRSDRLDAYYAATRPFTPREWLTITPVAGARVTHYAHALAGRRDYTRTLGELGVDAALRASATFDYRNERWGIDGLRHLVTPRVSYRYIPDATKGDRYIPAIDRRVFATYLEPLGLGGRRQIDDLAATNTVRFAIDQRLQTRDATYGSRDLASYQLAADARFDREPGERRWSSIHQELRLTPARWLAVEVYHRLSAHDGHTQEANVSFTLLDADRWALRVANHYLEGDIQEHLAGFAYRLNEVFELYTRIHYDARRQRFNEQSYGLNQTLDNRWIVGYELSFFEGPRRESDFGFNLRLQTVRF
jgi:LPS-assembly protein